MRKILSVNFFILSLFLFAINLRTSGQEIKPTAISTPKGVLIFLGNEIPKEFHYEVYKKLTDGNFTLIGSTTYPVDEKAMKSRIDEYSPLFTNLDPLNAKDIQHIRKYVSHNKTTDSLFTLNIPVMHLSIGTAIFDPDVKAGNSYQYNVRKMKDNSTQVWEKASNVLKYPAKINISKPTFKDKQEFRSQVIMRWYVQEQNQLNSFTMYRRVFGNGDFKKIGVIKGYNTSQDTVYLIAIDTTVQNPAWYEYYIEPYDIYGNAGPASDAIGAGTIGSSYNPVPDYFKARSLDQDHKVKLSWNFKDKRYLRGIDIYRSNSFDNGFTRVASLPASDTSFTDVVPVANQNYWYYLQIDGPMNQSLPSAKIAAMFTQKGEKPSPPAEVGAESIKGGVKIFWNYNEPYAKGFYVFRYKYENAEYMQISGLIPAGKEIYSFIDSSGYLQGNDIYRYAVKAVNDVDQLSDFSESASASPGIKAAMQSPMNIRINLVNNGVYIVWDDLQEVEPALLGYKVYRKLSTEKKYTLLPNDTLQRTKNYYNDTSLLPGKSYSYAVAALDLYGNESVKSTPVSYSQPEENIVPPVIEKVVNTIGGIMVSWGQVNTENIVSIKIYRTQPGKPSQVIANVQKGEEEFLDKTAAKGQLYIYEISLVTSDNQESTKSRGVSVRRD